MNVLPSLSTPAVMALCGHVGVGHTHSHSGFVQDDSAGFVTLVTLLHKAFPADLRIDRVTVDRQAATVSVTLASGGCGTAWARRGITRFEEIMLQQAVGRDATFVHQRTLEVFGRSYGQGVTELPLAFESALCFAVVDSFEKNWPTHFLRKRVGIPQSLDEFLGTIVRIDDLPVAVLLVINASKGGLGPDENLEGNTCLDAKCLVMQHLGMDDLPTIVIESKAYVPAVSTTLQANELWIRYNETCDNTIVGQALFAGAQQAGRPVRLSNTVYQRNSADLATATENFGQKLSLLGQALAATTAGPEKVRLVGELALLVSEDAGAITFMSDHVFRHVAGCGLWPGTGAVLSTRLSNADLARWGVPVFEPDDAHTYLEVLEHALPLLNATLPEALRELNARRMPPVEL